MSGIRAGGGALAAGVGAVLLVALAALLVWQHRWVPSTGVAQRACAVPDGGAVALPGGTFAMGARGFYPDEEPVRAVTLAPFSIDRFAVTNAEFARFVATTGYITDAERRPDPQDYPELDPATLQPGGAVFRPMAGRRFDPEDPSLWWEVVPGADWRHPAGPGSSIDGHEREPVVQISYRDATAYAAWRGRALPTEAQLEFAARGGLAGRTYAWGDEVSPGGRFMANTWQGTFPARDEGGDGFAGRSPVGCFPPNGFGLYDMTGNVWQWSATPFDPDAAGVRPARLRRVIKGGSYLCAPNYCRRYRPAAREAQESGFSSEHLGFRTVDHQ